MSRSKRSNIYSSQNLIRATQCKFPLQNIQFSCKTYTKLRIWNRFSVPHSRNNGEHFSPIFLGGKKACFLPKYHKFLEFSKSQSKTSKIHHFDYEYISAVFCTGERGQMAKLEKLATMHNCNFMGGCCFLYLCKNNLQKKLIKANMFVK